MWVRKLLETNRTLLVSKSSNFQAVIVWLKKHVVLLFLQFVAWDAILRVSSHFKFCHMLFSTKPFLNSWWYLIWWKLLTLFIIIFLWKISYIWRSVSAYSGICINYDSRWYQDLIIFSPLLNICFGRPFLKPSEN